MKIYILNVLPETLKNILHKLIDEFGNPEEKKKLELCSKEFGIQIIENEKIYHIESTFHTEYQVIKNYNNFDLLLDKTIYRINEEISQLPVNYICTPYYELKFIAEKKSDLSLIVECIQEIDNFEKNIIPINFYFIYEDNKLDLNNEFFKEKFNRFLSHFN